MLSKSYITTCSLADNEVSSENSSPRVIVWDQIILAFPLYVYVYFLCLQVAQFLSDSILEALQVYSGLKEPGMLEFNIFLGSVHFLCGGFKVHRVQHEICYYCTGTSNLLLHPGASGGFEGMTQLLQLCTDPSRLGQKLLDALSSFSTANIDINPKSKCYAFDGMCTVTILYIKKLVTS